MQPLYNREGRAIAYIADNGISIYFYDGEAAGWVYQNSLVFAYSGKFLGWLMYGWLCDPGGNPALFTDRSSGGPKRPALQPRPIRGMRDSRPARRQRELRPPRPGMTTTWSPHSDESFFAVAPGETLGPLEEAAPSAEPGSGVAPPSESGGDDAPPVAAPEPEATAAGPPATPAPGEDKTE